MSRIASHAAIAATALVAGGLGATAFSNPEPSREGAAATTQPLPPEQVRTVVVTKTIHRVRHVRVHARHQAPAAAPPTPVAVVSQPAPARVVPVATRRPAVLHTRTSGHGGGGSEREHEHEGGGDD